MTIVQTLPPAGLFREVSELTALSTILAAGRRSRLVGRFAVAQARALLLGLSKNLAIAMGATVVVLPPSRPVRAFIGMGALPIGPRANVTILALPRVFLAFAPFRLPAARARAVGLKQPKPGANIRLPRVAPTVVTAFWKIRASLPALLLAIKASLVAAVRAKMFRAVARAILINRPFVLGLSRATVPLPVISKMRGTLLPKIRGFGILPMGGLPTVLMARALSTRVASGLLSFAPLLLSRARARSWAGRAFAVAGPLSVPVQATCLIRVLTVVGAVVAAAKAIIRVALPLLVMALTTAFLQQMTPLIRPTLLGLLFMGRTVRALLVIQSVRVVAKSLLPKREVLILATTRLAVINRVALFLRKAVRMAFVTVGVLPIVPIVLLTGTAVISMVVAFFAVLFAAKPKAAFAAMVLVEPLTKRVARMGMGLPQPRAGINCSRVAVVTIKVVAESGAFIPI